MGLISENCNIKQVPIPDFQRLVLFMDWQRHKKKINKIWQPLWFSNENQTVHPNQAKPTGRYEISHFSSKQEAL